jgi:type II secretory pathway pseudopilin PulG
MKNNQKGFAMIEMVMVMTLLILFGVTIYTLIYSGVNTQNRITEEKISQTDARVAMSFLNVRLRQSDARDMIEVKMFDSIGSNAIVIKERNPEYSYDTWIYSYEGRLMEALVNPDEIPNPSYGFGLADVERLETIIDGGRITNTIYYYSGDTLRNMSSTLLMRSKQGGE